MGKRRVSVESCRQSPETTIALVVVWEKQKVEGETQEVPLGEQSISFPTNTPPPEVIVKIKEAAKAIVKAAQDAKTTREHLNKLLEKESVE